MFPSQFGFEPCYVNSRLVSRGIPVACEVDIYGALSEYIGMCVSGQIGVVAPLAHLSGHFRADRRDAGITGG